MRQENDWPTSCGQKYAHADRSLIGCQMVKMSPFENQRLKLIKKKNFCFMELAPYWLGWAPCRLGLLFLYLYIFFYCPMLGRIDLNLSPEDDLPCITWSGHVGKDPRLHCNKIEKRGFLSFWFGAERKAMGLAVVSGDDDVDGRGLRRWQRL